MSDKRPRVIQVIESEDLRGKGEMGNPYRRVVMYHTLDGNFLAERDDWSERQLERDPAVSLTQNETDNG